jgi:hypothetical protein
MNSKDAREGPRVFLEKRTPNFTGEPERDHQVDGRLGLLSCRVWA